MIDFIDVIIPLNHDGNINNGYKLSAPKNSIQNTKYYEEKVYGRHHELMHVVSISKDELRISGSPLMFLQGQNVFGTDDINALVHQVAMHITHQLVITPTKKNIKAWKKGLFQVIRLDITYNFLMPSRDSVVDWLAEAGLNVWSGKQYVDAIRSSSLQGFETIMLGKSSRFISVKFYDKYKQLQSNKSMEDMATTYPAIRQLLDHSQRLLRCEIRLHHKYLKRNNLTKGKDLTLAVLRQHYFNKLNSVNFGSSTILPKSAITSLTKTEYFTYKLWLRGENVKELVPDRRISKSSLSRLDIKLQPFGVAIRRKQAKQVAGKELSSFLDPSNIADTPDFLKDTPWLFEP
jgi:hypothetical protein